MLDQRSVPEGSSEVPKDQSWPADEVGADEAIFCEQLPCQDQRCDEQHPTQLKRNHVPIAFIGKGMRNGVAHAAAKLRPLRVLGRYITYRWLVDLHCVFKTKPESRPVCARY